MVDSLKVVLYSLHSSLEFLGPNLEYQIYHYHAYTIELWQCIHCTIDVQHLTGIANRLRRLYHRICIPTILDRKVTVVGE